MSNPVHHIELWTHDLAQVEPSFDWLLPRLGWAADHDPAWPQGRVWLHPSGAYVTLEQSPAVTAPHDRMRAGLNHLALRIDHRSDLDGIRAQAGEHGWSELFAEAYPHAGGPGHTALFLENVQGFEVEIVVA
ncbi:VOC family protein [Serinicoccus kebangsaanensis]|uniref:VOC family protein n=1 Tax=Serinicoccus kebangsaanensis TaxID=2602069 RepID=UPI00124C2D91|nr:VOC family protein [Serinicoccus kebangsaanensis]